jgi:hypothetical protein
MPSQQRLDPTLRSANAVGLDELVGTDYVARACLRLKLFSRPELFAAGVGALVIFGVAIPGFLFSYVHRPHGVIPIWRDYPAAPVLLTWVLVGWAYAWHPAASGRVIERLAALLPIEASRFGASVGSASISLPFAWGRRTQVLHRLLSYPILALVFVAFCGVWSLTIRLAESGPRSYFEIHLSYFVLWGISSLAIAYMAIVGSMRQALIGQFIGHLADKIDVSKPDHAAFAVRSLPNIGSEVVKLVIPFVFAAVALLTWFAASLLHPNYAYELLLLALIALYVPLMSLCLLYPLWRMTRTLSAVRRAEQARLAPMIERARRAAADAKVEDVALLATRMSEVRIREEHLKLVLEDIPLIPVAGLSMRAIAVGGLLETVSAITTLVGFGWTAVR